MPIGTLESPAEQIARWNKDRRTLLRYKFSAHVELVDNVSGDHREGRATDLSLRGCSVEMKPSVPVGTIAKMRIVKGEKAFEAQVRVVFAEVGKGIGVLFTSISPTHVPILETWVGDSRETSWLAANRRRSQRILLKVPVRVSGLEGGTPAFEEDSNTLAISAHGALVLLSTPVRKGQSLLLSNVRTGSSVECIVAHIGEPEGQCLQIGMAFLLPNSSLWPVNFPPEDWSPRHEDAKQQVRRPVKS